MTGTAPHSSRVWHFSRSSPVERADEPPCITNRRAEPPARRYDGCRTASPGISSGPACSSSSQQPLLPMQMTLADSHASFSSPPPAQCRTTGLRLRPTQGEAQAVAQAVAWGMALGVADDFLADCLHSDPWAGCEDLAQAGLTEWHVDFSRLRNSRRQDNMASCFHGFLASPGCSTGGVKQCAVNTCRSSSSLCAEAGRGSLSTLSTASSLGGRHSVAAFGDAHAPSQRLSPSPSCDSPLILQASQNNSDDDWELEFMMRASMDADARGAALHGSTVGPSHVPDAHSQRGVWDEKA